jgi:hypothetical protein
MSAFPEGELQGRDGKTVSVLRDMTPPGEVAQRAFLRNKEQAWASDPVIAKASVRDLRQMYDAAGRRELCVNADPIRNDNDSCPTHASVLRSNPPPDAKHRLIWARLRVELATKFEYVAHCSGRQIAPLGS